MMKRTHSMPKKYKEFILTFPKKRRRNENKREAELLNINDDNELQNDHNTKTKKCKNDNFDELLNNTNSNRDGDCLLDQKIETISSSLEYEEDSLDDEKVNLNITKGSNGREGKKNTASLNNLDDEIIDAQEEDLRSASTDHNNFDESFSDDSIEVTSISSSEFSDHHVLSSPKYKQYEGCIDDNEQSNDDNEIDNKDSDIEEETRKENDEESDEDNTKKHEDPGANFNFTIPFSEWAKLPYVDKVSYKRLGGNWADVFAKHFNKVQPMCVLIFKYNRIARSHKAANYGSFSAHCKHEMCSANYKMTISDEPEGKSSVVVNVCQTGKLSKENEEKSRFVKGQRRSAVKQELSTKSPYM